ncbi:MAG: universal stress protein [Alphaproteobacteria bacterium]|nr:universal stress protein [Alphaproteobacteria bacterium]
MSEDNNRDQNTPNKFLVCVAENAASPVALRMACKKARRRGDGVDILTVVQPMDFQPLFGVGERISDEKREQAEALLHELAGIAQDECNITPTLHLREGKLGEQIIAAVMEDSDVNMLIIGLMPDSPKGTKLVTWLSERMGDELLVPMTIVPGNLTDQQLDALV